MRIRSNLCELANRLIHDTLRNMTAEIYCQATYFHLLLGPTVLLINSLTFSNHKHLSPHLIVFGTLPRQGLINIFEGNEQIFEGKHDYIKSIILLNDSFSRLRLAQIESRQYKHNSKKVEEYFDKIQIGSIISIKNPEIKIKEQDFKLRPRLRTDFW